VRRDPRYLTNRDDSGSELILSVTGAGPVISKLDVESDLIGAFGAAEIARYERPAHALRPMWEDQARKVRPERVCGSRVVDHEVYRSRSWERLQE
jgi:hypothetical protein